MSSSPPPPPMDLPTFSVGGDYPVTAPFEWSEFLDLAFDDQLFLPPEDFSDRQVEEPAEVPPPPAPPRPEVEEADADAVEPLSDRVRKRDPRLVCSNFLAGIVPCACPEMDAMMEEQEEKEAGGPWKKRVRVARGAKARCQVPDCTADISELKGYHRRHRVCLACANATSVVLDGESKRYCQQCGKFHILPDFDEGKRSCRRKLERHNNRRRRKPIDSRGAADKEPQLNLLGEDMFSDEESGKGNLCSTSQSTEGDVLQVSNGGNMPNLFSGPDSKVILSDSGVTFTASGETQVDGGNDDSKYALSPYYDSKNGYSSVCPTGRISFKLYDWNPAEFPRRLRLQIFQWLASMPVELEGYIRPGCTILTAFISMPQFMWVKLFEDPASYVHNFLAPGRALSGRGTALVYVNNKVFRVLRDGMSLVEANVAKLAPKVHYVHPSCFEAGKPMEFIVCGSNLFQPNFRSLVSFAGKYLDHEYSVAFPSEKINAETSMSFDHQFCRICVRFTEPKFYGPAFIEIENESGLSNFMPIIICDEQVCSEIKMIQDKYNLSFEVTPCIEAGEPPHYTHQAACLGQPIFSNFMLDLAWLLKQPAAEKLQQEPTSSEIQRFGHLLRFLVRHDSVYILNRILGHMEAVADQAEDNITSRVVDTDRKFLQEQFDQARKFLCQKLKIDWHASTSVQKGDQFSYKFFEDDAVTIIPIEQKDLDIRAERNLITSECSTSTLKDQTTPLLNKEVAVDMFDMKHQLKESRSLIRSRPSILMMVAFAICFGVCTVLLHPSHVSRILVSIKSCLFEYSP